MAGRKFVEMEEAAKMLGISTDALNEMRERHEIYPVRDGGAWKFRVEDVERLVADRAAGGGGIDDDFAEMDDNLDSILLSEVALGSGPSTSSTVIGKMDGPPSEESDIQIAKANTKDGESDLHLDFGSDVQLAAGGSDLTIDQPSSGLKAQFEELDTLDLDMPSAADSGLNLGSDLGLGSDIKLGSSGHLTGSSKKPGSGPIAITSSAAAEEDDDLTLDNSDMALGEGSGVSLSEGGSDVGGSAIELATDDDDDLVLGGSGSGSDLTHAVGDSGISLVDPADSGLSLDQAPMELGGSAVESLELGEDDMILLEEEGDADSATQLKTDDDFLLTPLDDAGGEESDSGSQVIALDSEVEFDEAAATMLGSRPGGLAPMLEEDMSSGDFGSGLGDFDGGGGGPLTMGGATLTAGAPMMNIASAPEAPYSIFNVLSLAICVLFLMLGGMMMYDLIRNMWSWNGAYAVNSNLMDTVLGWFEK